MKHFWDKEVQVCSKMKLVISNGPAPGTCFLITEHKICQTVLILDIEIQLCSINSLGSKIMQYYSNKQTPMMVTNNFFIVKIKLG